MSRHLIDLLDDLKNRVARMSALVQHIVEQAIDAVLDADAELARTTIASASAPPSTVSVPAPPTRASGPPSP